MGSPQLLQRPHFPFPQQQHSPPWHPDWRSRTGAEGNPFPPFPRGPEDLRQQVVELRRYIDRLEVEREVEIKKHEAEKTELNQRLALAKENLEKNEEEYSVEIEKLKEKGGQLAEEQAKVEAERKTLESEKREMEEKSKSCEENREGLIKNSMEYLTQEKEKTDLEMKLNEVERKSLEEKRKLCARIRHLQNALTVATLAKEKEESHQLSVRRQEKEFKEGMLDNLNSKERKIEDLES